MTVATEGEPADGIHEPLEELPSASGDEAADGPPPHRRRMPRLRYLLVAALTVTISAWAMLTWVDRLGTTFFYRGRSMVELLAAAAASLHAGDYGRFESLLAGSYSGGDLGLATLRLAEERDGIRRYDWRPPETTLDRKAAVAEWRAYLSSFAEIEELGLHVHRVESWRSSREIAATVRFELIGRPRDEPRSGVDRALFRMRFTAGEDHAWRIASAELLEGSRIISGFPHFVDVAEAAGVDFENRYYPPFLPENRDEPLRFGMLKYGPAGITAADVDHDGFHDLFIPDGVEAKLFRNRADGSGGFDDVTAQAGLAGLDGVGVGLFADLDDDGFEDLFVSRTFRPNQLFRNRGDHTFEDVTATSGLGADCCTTVASVGDVDRDGDLDLYVGRYLDPRLGIPTTFYARNGEPNQLYRNDGGFRFTNVTEESGVGETGLCLGSVFADIDDDGDLDLYVVNDFGRKTLYRNRGDGRFDDVTVESGALAYGAGMSASAGDYDNDLDLDLYVAHIRSEHSWFAEWPTVARYMANTWTQGVWRSDMPLYLEIFRQSGFAFVDVFQQMASGNTLLRNAGEGTFEDVSWEAEANPLGWFWGSGFADFDNDGWLDLYSANGWVYNDRGTEIELSFLDAVVGEMQRYKSGVLFDPAHFGRLSWHGWERNRHLRSRGPDADGVVTFEEIGHATGTDLLLNSRGVAVADFWNRGALDLAVAASTDRHALLRNDVGTRRNWLAVELVGGAGRLPLGSNRNAVGARVEIDFAGGSQLRELALGDGYGSQSTLRLTFGLGGERNAGEAPIVDELRVRWPRSGETQRFAQVAANRIVEVREGSDELIEKVYGPSSAPTQPDGAVPMLEQ